MCIHQTHLFICIVHIYVRFFVGFEWDSLMEVVHEPIEKNYKLLEEIGK